jgi:hypothetical protein
MGIRITDKKSKMPNALKLVSHISTFLFEEEYGELKYMKASEIEAVKKASRALQRASARTSK